MVTTPHGHPVEHTGPMATNASDTVLTGTTATAVYTALYQQMISGMTGGEPNGTAAYLAVFNTVVKQRYLAAYPPAG